MCVCSSPPLDIKMWCHPMIATTGGSHRPVWKGRTAITGVLPSDLMGWTHFMKRFLTPAFARGAIKYPMLDIQRGHTL